MSGHAHSTAAEIRARVGHPIVDADGHWLEFGVVGLDALRRTGGDKAAEGFAKSRARIRESLSMSVAERQRRWIAQETFWAFPTKNTLDVPDTTLVMPEAYEMVERGLIDAADFRDFTFANAVRFFGTVNADFFKGTVVEKAAASVLADR